MVHRKGELEPEGHGSGSCPSLLTSPPEPTPRSRLNQTVLQQERHVSASFTEKMYVKEKREANSSFITSSQSKLCASAVGPIRWGGPTPLLPRSLFIIGALFELICSQIGGWKNPLLRLFDLLMTAPAADSRLTRRVFMHFISTTQRFVDESALWDTVFGIIRCPHLQMTVWAE